MKRKAINAILTGLVSAGLIASCPGCGMQIVTDTVGAEYKSDEPETEYDFSNLRAQDDYYGYINYAELSQLEYGYFDNAVGAFDQDAVNIELIEMIQMITSSDEEYVPGSNEQIIRDTYRQIEEFLDTKESGAVDYFNKKVEEIKSAESVEDIKKQITELKRDGIISYFVCGVEEDFFDGENYSLLIGQMRGFGSFELKDIYENDETRQLLHGYLMDVMVATGEDTKTASDKADDFVYMIMDISFDTDYEIMEALNPVMTLKYKSESEMDSILENISVAELEKMYEVTNPYGGWYIQDEEQLKTISSKLNDDNLENLKIWLICDVMNTYKELLNTEYPFLGSNTGMSKELMALMCVEKLFPIQLSELYEDYYYTEEMDEQLHRMYEDIIRGYRELMTEATWLTEATRAEMIKKLENMVFVIGAGKRHEINEEDAKLVGKDIFETYVNAKRAEVDEQINNIGKKIDKSESAMASYWVNACYSSCNTFTITVAIMHSPFFDVNADYASNMGGLGMVMGHEIGHAFDSNCIYYDENGKYDPSRICEEDIEELSNRLTQIEEYYSSFTIMDIYHVDGVKTSGENYADKGAMECLMKIITDDKDREKLFENYARIWLEITCDEAALYNLENDEHSPAEIRVNAVLSATPEFYEVYDVQPSDGMYVEPERRVGRWY